MSRAAAKVEGNNHALAAAAERFLKAWRPRLRAGKLNLLSQIVREQLEHPGPGVSFSERGYVGHAFGGKTSRKVVWQHLVELEQLGALWKLSECGDRPARGRSCTLICLSMDLSALPSWAWRDFKRSYPKAWGIICERLARGDAHWKAYRDRIVTPVPVQPGGSTIAYIHKAGTPGDPPGIVLGALCSLRARLPIPTRSWLAAWS